MKRYRILFFLMAALMMTSCLDEHPRISSMRDAIYGSASEIYTNAVASLYNYIGGALSESEGIQGTCRASDAFRYPDHRRGDDSIRGGDWYDGGLSECHVPSRLDGGVTNRSMIPWKYLYKVIVLASRVARHHRCARLLPAHCQPEGSVRRQRCVPSGL